MELSPNQLQDSLGQVLQAGLVPFITSKPGEGKSDIVRAVADKYKLSMIDLRLSQCDPTDLLGLPSIKDRRMNYAPPMHFPLEGLDEVPANYNGWCILLDEMPSASLAVQSASYKLVLDRMIGVHHLHKKVVIVCAGNRITDGAIVNRTGTAMQTRLIHLGLNTTTKDWLEWAARNEIDYRVSAYIAQKPDVLSVFDPKHNDDTFCCPRTWFFTSKLIKGVKEIGSRLPVIAGAITEGQAREFISYTDLTSKLPTIQQVKQNPKAIGIDTEPSLLFFMSHMVASHMNMDNVDLLMQYINRLPEEFGIIALRNAIQHDKKLFKAKPIDEWKNRLAIALY